MMEASTSGREGPENRFPVEELGTSSGAGEPKKSSAEVSAMEAAKSGSGVKSTIGFAKEKGSQGVAGKAPSPATSSTTKNGTNDGGSSSSKLSRDSTMQRHERRFVEFKKKLFRPRGGLLYHHTGGQPPSLEVLDPRLGPSLVATDQVAMFGKDASGENAAVEASGRGEGDMREVRKAEAARKAAAEGAGGREGETKGNNKGGNGEFCPPPAAATIDSAAPAAAAAIPTTPSAAAAAPSATAAGDDKQESKVDPLAKPAANAAAAAAKAAHPLLSSRKQPLYSYMGAYDMLSSGLASSLVSNGRQAPAWQIDPKELVIKGRIASGAYGSVHRGKYRGRTVAVKLLDWGKSDDVSSSEVRLLRDAFAQEVIVWSQLAHPNVCQFIGAILGGAKAFNIPMDHDDKNRQHAEKDKQHMVVGKDVCFLVLEYIPGGTLKQLLIKHHKTKLPLNEVVKFALHTARGLAYLHSKGIVHRDVKSDNLLLDKDKTVKVADFGVSRVEPAEKAEMFHRAGTIGYMAPEVLQELPYDHKADVYSFGILLWETFCCDNPFPFMDFSVEDVNNLVNQGLRPEIPSICPKRLKDLMEVCWHKDPSKRPDMDDVVASLSDFAKMCEIRNSRSFHDDSGGSSLNCKLS